MQVFKCLVCQFVERSKLQRDLMEQFVLPTEHYIAKQHLAITAEATVDNILDTIKTALKPKRLDLQNRSKLFAFKQGTNMSAMQYLQDSSRQLYNLTLRKLIEK